MSSFNTHSFNINPYSGALVVINNLNDQVHRGNLFVASGIASIDSLASAYVLFQVPEDCSPYFQGFTLDAGSGPITITWYESPTTTGGVLVPSVNTNRTSSHVSLTQLYMSPSVTSEGSLLLTRYIPLGKHEGGEGASNGIEWVLRPNTNYLAKITNGANQTVSLAFYTKWYEIE